eukprot:GCRY01002246.1.p1 GENE.GCRY01002246.1~~GCRY01002246.1.p1  ORF type:complete len:160 (+),score=19.31 GCRY01002246.1:174-653(+)
MSQQQKLHKAASLGDVDLIDKLIEEGNPVVCTNEMKSTPLHHAAAHGFVPIAERLLKQLSTEEITNFVNLQTISGNSALHLSCRFGQLDFVNLLLKTPGIKVNLQDTEGKTPLHLASFYGHTLCVRTLLKAGADRTITENDGKTPAEITTLSEIQSLLS